jgi:hypothetical protein
LFWLVGVFGVSLWILRLIFLFLWRTTLEFWWRLHRICRLLLLKIISVYLWTWETFLSTSIFYCFLWCLVSL